MRLHYVKQMLATCFFFVFFFCGNSYGQSCTSPGLDPQGSFHFGASGGSLTVTVTAATQFTLPAQPPNICGWGASSLSFVQVQPSSMPFMLGTPNQTNVTPAKITIDQNPDLAPRSGNVVFTGADNAPNAPSISISQDAASGDFSLSDLPSSLTLTKGASASTTVFINRTGQFIGVVCLNVPPASLPPGVTVQFSPLCTTGNSSVATISTSAATPVGMPTPVITGVNTIVSRSTGVSLTVDDFSLSLNPPSLTVVQGSNNSGQVIINPINGFSGCVGLGPSNVPDGVGFNFSPNPACGGSSTMTVNANGFGQLGTFQVQIDGFNQNQRRDPFLTLTVAGFTLSASPATSTVPPGGNTSYHVNAVPSTGYTEIGTVQLAPPSGLPSGINASVTSNGPGSFTVKIQNNGAIPGTYPLTFTGTDVNGVSKSANVTLIVGPLAVASRYVPVTPCRVVDTRNSNGPFGPFLVGNTIREFDIPNSACNIPSSALAYALNATVVPHGPLGFLTMFPCGQNQPASSNLNSIDGRVKAVAAIVPAGPTNGGVCVFASNDTDVILDISGYFDPATNSSALAFYPMTPCRLVDTRNATGPLGGPFLTGNTTRAFPVLASGCNVPSSAQVYSLNFTAVPRNGNLGFLTAWSTGQSQPPVSTLNAPTGTITANAGIVQAGASGDISVFVTNDSDLVIDINGYFAPAGAGGLSLFPLVPCRVLDTRNPPGSSLELDPQGPASSAPFSGTISVNVTASGCGSPTSSQAYVLNATVVPPGPLGYLTLWSNGAPQPLVSTLNAIDGAVTSNMAIVPTNNGSVNAFASNPTQLVLDITGYFAP